MACGPRRLGTGEKNKGAAWSIKTHASKNLAVREKRYAGKGIQRQCSKNMEDGITKGAVYITRWQCGYITALRNQAAMVSNECDISVGL